jgi:hypothetical protein
MLVGVICGTAGPTLPLSTAISGTSEKKLLHGEMKSNSIASS